MSFPRPVAAAGGVVGSTDIRPGSSLASFAMDEHTSRLLASRDEYLTLGREVLVRHSGLVNKVTTIVKGSLIWYAPLPFRSVPRCDQRSLSRVANIAGA